MANVYTNGKTKLKWKCKKGHIWHARPSNIKNGNWCKLCWARKNGDKKKLTIEESKNLATKNGGKCLSNIYISNLDKLEWECSVGHKFFMCVGNIKQKGSYGWRQETPPRSETTVGS